MIHLTTNNFTFKLKITGISSSSTIFIVVNSFGKGGAEMSLAVLAAELAKLEHNVFYIALWHEVDSYDFDWLRAVGVNVCILSNTRSDYLARLGRFSNLLKEKRPEFIYSAMLNSNIISQVFSLLYRIPHAASVRNNPATYYGNIWYKKLFFSIGMMFQRHVVFISAKVKSEYLNSTYGKLLKRKKCYVLHNPIETDVCMDDDSLYEKFNLTRKKVKAFLNADSNNLVLVIACRLVKGKGVLEFLESSKSKLKDIRLQLYIYGTGPLEADLRNYIFNQFPAGNVRLMGYEKDIYKVYGKADIFVFPSMSEGFGRAPFEALLMGAIVVCNDKVSIIEEFLEDTTVWKDYSICPDWDVIFSEISYIDPYTCVESVKTVREMLSPQNHANEFIKMIDSFD